ncbi:TPA: hypothetical protein TVG13_000582, partial [Streptococcus equi subsp. zooepidemicus]|nr:hypothetical protein [Streptococcus equi subsp. zooepidemicus]
MMISDSSYKEMAKQVYNIEPSKAKSNDAPIVLKGNRLIDYNTGKQYRVLLVQ